MDAHKFLIALTCVLGVAAITSVIFQKLRQPVVLGYILAGFIIGPYVPVPLVADEGIVRVLSELGVMLVMFSLGLEFSLSKLIRLGPTLSFTAIFESSLMVWLGFVVGRSLGWTLIESLFAGAIVSISSTTIIAKAFEEQNIRGALRERVFGVLIVEDLIAILLMATLTAVASGVGLSAASMAYTFGKLALFLVVLMVVGLLIVPRGVRAILRLGRPETTLVASVGFCFAISLLAQELGYSVALGAFIAGSLVAESGEHLEIEPLVHPVRDMFAAIFFVSVGLSINPHLIVQHRLAILAFTGIVIAGKVIGVGFGSFLSGNGVRTSIRAGMSMAQIGEFSFIIAALGLSLRATRPFLYPIAVAVSIVTTLTTPALIKLSGPIASFVDRKLPRPVQTFLALYGSWIEQLGARPKDPTRGAQIRRLLRLLVIDAALLVIVVVGTVLGNARLSRWISAGVGLDQKGARLLIIALAALFATPLIGGIVRVASRLGLVIAQATFPAGELGKLDLSATPRRSLLVTLQLAIVLATGLPVLALTQPFLGGVYGPVLLGLVLVGLGVSFWKGATELHGHVQAGAQTLVEALMAQAKPSTVEAGTPEISSAGRERIRELLSGLGEPTLIELEGAMPGVGKSLAQLNLRGRTGATVLAITRGVQGHLVPTATEVLQAGDILALAGSHDAIDEARAILTEAS